MVEPSIDTLGWWPVPFGQAVLPTVRPQVIPRGASIAFTFPAPESSAVQTPSVWTCTIHVVAHRGGEDVIEPFTVVQDGIGLYSGVLSTEQTADLDDADTSYFLVAVFASPGPPSKEIVQFVRFQVRTPWVSYTP